MATKDWSNDKRAVRASIWREIGRWASRSRRNWVARDLSKPKARVHEKESNKIYREDRDEAYEERNQIEEEEKQEKGRTTHLRLQSFSKKCKASAITVDHIPTSFTSLPVLGRAHVNHNVLGFFPGKTFGLRTSRVKNLSALKLISD